MSQLPDNIKSNAPFNVNLSTEEKQKQLLEKLINNAKAKQEQSQTHSQSSQAQSNNQSQSQQPRQVSENTKEKSFIAELPDMSNPEVVNKMLPAISTTQSVARLAGVCNISYVPLQELKEGDKVPQNMSAACFGVTLPNGNVKLEVQFSTTNIARLFNLVSNFTFEGIITCEFISGASSKSNMHPLVHLEPVQPDQYIKALQSESNTFTGFYRPIAVYDANNRMGVVEYHLTNVRDMAVVDSITLELKQTTLSAWVQALNDKFSVEQGGFPLMDLANFTIARQPPAT